MSLPSQHKPRLMALDIGTKTCGIAVTDELGLITQPLTTLRYRGKPYMHKVLAELTDLIRQYQPATLVIGLPYNMNGTEGPQAKMVREFVNALKNHFKKNNINPQNYTWDFFDERCTSEEADSFLLEHNVSRKKRKEVMDKLAAVFILKRYLEER
ncbi:MAG: Holliday junction resolvase RuvX [Deltaproteobacteria bacterium]|nr:Holliday junction resolvase RuvX [Deltaproteobacteria bacterium]